MGKKIKLTRPELKRHRDALSRYERYLPMLKLKQQQLQITLREAVERRIEAERARDAAHAAVQVYRSVLADRAGVPLESLSRPSEVKTAAKNIAGVEIPVFQEVVFPPAIYSLFGTPPWVDQTLADLRERSRCEAMAKIASREETLLRNELARIVQRVNLFEKVMIPTAREAIRMIRIHLGDQMTAAVGRSKIAKNKLADTLSVQPAAAPPETNMEGYLE